MNTTRRRLPGYARTAKRPLRFTFITAEWEVARAILRARGPILVVDFDPSACDLDLLSGCECYVLWLRDEFAARRLAEYVAGWAASGFLIRAGALANG